MSDRLHNLIIRGVLILWSVLFILVVLRNRFIIYLFWLNASAICQHFHWHHKALGVVLALNAMTALGLCGLWPVGLKLSKKIVCVLYSSKILKT